MKVLIILTGRKRLCFLLSEPHELHLERAPERSWAIWGLRDKMAVA